MAQSFRKKLRFVGILLGAALLVFITVQAGIRFFSIPSETQSPPKVVEQVPELKEGYFRVVVYENLSGDNLSWEDSTFCNQLTSHLKQRLLTRSLEVIPIRLQGKSPEQRINNLQKSLQVHRPDFAILHLHAEKEAEEKTKQLVALLQDIHDPDAGEPPLLGMIQPSLADLKEDSPSGLKTAGNSQWDSLRKASNTLEAMCHHAGLSVVNLYPSFSELPPENRTWGNNLWDRAGQALAAEEMAEAIHIWSFHGQLPLIPAGSEVALSDGSGTAR